MVVPGRSDFEMRTASVCDLYQVQEITSAAYAVYSELLGRPPLPVVEDYLPRLRRGEVWLQSLDGRISGLAVVVVNIDHLLIFSLAVLAEMQGKGCGQALLSWSEEYCCQQGLAQIRLYTNAKMERNIRIYRRFGFVEVARQESQGLPGSFRVDMQKNVGNTQSMNA